MSDNASTRIDRRNFLVGGAVVGSGLYIGMRFAKHRFDAPPPAGAGRTFAPNAFLRIAPDDTVTVVIGKSEMGQGIYTGMAMALAEELDIDPARVKVEFGPVDAAFNVPFAPVQFTGGSMSTSTTFMQLREAGARARAMLLAAAAKRWDVGVEELHTDDGKVFLAGKKLSYGKLADAAAQLAVPEKVALKDPALFRYLGKPHDAARFAHESGRQREIRHRHARAGNAVRRDRAAASHRRQDRQGRRHGGARGIGRRRRESGLPAGIAVYGTNTWAAKRGREALKITWNEGANRQFFDARRCGANTSNC